METKIMKQNVGVDVAKEDFKVSLMQMRSDLSMVIKGSRTFANTPSGYEQAIAWSVKKSSAELPLSFTMEATGVYYEGLAYRLFAENFPVLVVLPNQSKKYGQSLGIKSKTDKIDAGLLAQMGLERPLFPWRPFSPHFRILKRLTREREALLCDRTVALNRRHAYSSEGMPEKESIDRTTGLIRFYEAQAKEIEQQIKRVVQSDQALEKRLSYVESIKGVGFITAVTIVSETNGFAGFRNIKQLTSFAGIDVKIRESGKWKGKSRISKCGNRHIRKALHMPSLAKIAHDRKTDEYYSRLFAKKGIRMVAVVAVQRKLLGLIYSLWKKQEMFDPSR
jgi:transposase